MIPFLEKNTLPQVIHKLKYSQPLERWHAYDGEMYYGPIHCGEGFCIRIKDCYFKACMELDTHWYVFIDHEKFRLHPKQIYDVILQF